jgi:hypothetical protein
MQKQDLKLIQEARLTIPQAENLLAYVQSVLAGNLTEFDRLRLADFESDLKRSIANLVSLGHQDRRWAKFVKEYCDQCEDYLRLIGKEYAGKHASN